jgi:hypothetical protein
MMTMMMAVIGAGSSEMILLLLYWSFLSFLALVDKGGERQD